MVIVRRPNLFNKIFCIVFLASVLACTQKQKAINQTTENYPTVWWQGIPPSQKKSWEISPDSVAPPKVILSKRNQLGLLSNFAATPFVLDGKTYASVEGFWQATKYPESQDDPRFKWADWPHRRQEVEKMTAFEAKRAGGLASQLMQKNQWPWVTYQNKKMLYRDPKKGPFYNLVKRAMTAKMEQNPSVQKVLCSTGSLQLLPDHDQGVDPPPAWQYHKIWQDLRSQHCRQ